MSRRLFRRLFPPANHPALTPAGGACEHEATVREFPGLMITFLYGKLVEALPTQVVMDVNGVGYEVLIPLSSFDKLPPPATN